MKARRRPTRCGKWRRCGGAEDERDLYPVASGAEAIRPVPGPNHRLTRPAAPLPPGPGLWPEPGVSARGRGELSPVHGTRRDWDDDSLYFDLLRNVPALGPPVRISQGDTGCTGAENPDHGGPHAGWGDSGDDPG